jgi:hypothetical protein
MAAALAFASVASAGDPGPAPTRVFLEGVSDDVVDGLDAAKVDAELRKKLAVRKTIVLAPEAEGATVTLRVTECLGWIEKRKINEAGDRPVAGPTGKGGIARGHEGAYGVRTEEHPQVSLTVRATWGEHFVDLQSSDSDRTLRDAVESVSRELDALVRGGLRPPRP